MNFDFQGYPLKFIQREKCKDDSAHLYTYIFRFYSPVTKLTYIVRAEYHQEEVFAIKFYCKKDRHSEFKYSKITNKGDLGNILISCAKLVPELLQSFPSASFGFVGSRTLDKKSKKVENYRNNQRFRIYREITFKKFGEKTFAHIEYPAISGYLLLNRTSDGNLLQKEAAIKQMFESTYNNLPDL